MTIGGVDTYYDYDEHQWKFRRLGGGPVHGAPACPVAGTPQPNEKTPSPPATADDHETH